jgi:hypothetical protein
MLGFKGAQSRRPGDAIDIERPEVRNRAGRNSDIAIAGAPIPLDGFGVAGGGIKAARDGGRLPARQTWKDR